VHLLEVKVLFGVSSCFGGDWLPFYRLEVGAVLVDRDGVLGVADVGVQRPVVELVLEPREMDGRDALPLS
jgi:hypothetical protein